MPVRFQKIAQTCDGDGNGFLEGTEIINFQKNGVAVDFDGDNYTLNQKNEDGNFKAKISNNNDGSKVMESEGDMKKSKATARGIYDKNDKLIYHESTTVNKENGEKFYERAGISSDGKMYPTYRSVERADKSKDAVVYADQGTPLFVYEYSSDGSYTKTNAVTNNTENYNKDGEKVENN